MLNYQGANTFPGDVQLYDVTDSVVGGFNGTSNIPLKELADRTIWLKDQLGVCDRLRGEEVRVASSNPLIVVDNSLSGKLLTVIADAMPVISLDDAANFKHGTIIPICVFAGPGKVARIQTIAGQFMFDTEGNFNVLYMHHKEKVMLCALTDHWKIVYSKGNFDCVGEEVKARKILPGTLPMMGQLLDRASYPRLWGYVASLTVGQEVVSEATWNSGGFLGPYKGLFSLGNGLTTFRLPDERGMFDRMLDLGRGVDVSRPHNYPGGYEEDQLKAHTHPLTMPVVQHISSSANWGVTDGPPATGVNASKNFTGIGTAGTGPETIVKNLGKYNLIKY